MQIRLSIMFMLVAALASEVSAAGGCPAGKGVCVDRSYCKGSRWNRWNSLKPHKCVLPNNNRGICCDGCTTTRGGPGLCVTAERCGNYTRDFFVDQNVLNESQWWKKSSGVCYEEWNTKFYCCPTELLKPTVLPKSTSSPMRTSMAKATASNDNAFPSCQTPTHQPGRCVPLRFCDSLYDKFMFHRTEKVDALIRASICQWSGTRGTAVCCQNPQNPDGRIRHSKAVKFDLEKCGKIALTDKILEGTAADLGQFPWMANIMYHWSYKSGLRKITLCSGSLIHPKYVLTAAHCFKRGLKPISVRLGEYDLSKSKDCVGNVCAGQIIEYGIEDKIIHKEYAGDPGKADIALVRLEVEAKIIPGQISPICLPLTEQWLMTKPSQLTVSGWGQMGNQRFSDVLMHAELEIVERVSDCQAKDVICARGKDMAGHCRGDSGGPLQQVMPIGRKYRMVLFGVVSGGPAKCSKENDTPGISMSVGYYIRWILDNMRI